jgi:hypothetical protein
MIYPTSDEVDHADHLQLARWFRFLPPPGACGVGGSRALFYKVFEREKPIMDRIVARLKEMGGMTPKISKAIGWEKP